MDISVKESGDVPFMRNTLINYKKYSTNQPSQKQHSQRRCTPNTSMNSSKNKLLSKFSIKGISLLSFTKTNGSMNGSMTLEAAIVLPLFMIFFFNLLWVIEVYRLHSTLLIALRETGYKMSIYGYAYEKIIEEKDDSGLEAIIENIAFSELYVRGQVERIAGEEYLESSPLTHGKKSISYLESNIMQQNDIIDLVALYQISPFIQLVGFSKAGLYTRYYGRAWTGYDVSVQNDDQDRQVVYITQNGSVYHINRQCAYINLSIKKVSYYQISDLRNESGERYGACELCVDNQFDVIYFITEDGNRYHQNINCSSLSRYVYQIPYKEAKKKYHACSLCGR